MAQQENFDPIALKKYANKKMIEWFVHVKDFITYPINITVGTGNESYQKPIRHQYELFAFLRSEESLKAFNTGEAEIVILATIINQPTHLVMYNLQGLPFQTPLLERCRIQTIYPKEFLLYENNVHFSLLVDKNEGVQPLPSTTEADLPSTFEADLPSTSEAEEVLTLNPEGIVNSTTEAQHEFIDHLFSSMFPGEDRAASEEVIIGHLNRTEEINTADCENDIGQIPECPTMFKPQDT